MGEDVGEDDDEGSDRSSHEIRAFFYIEPGVVSIYPSENRVDDIKALLR
jgi:hypothetical protein